jgi:uncharacterized membrane protein
VLLLFAFALYRTARSAPVAARRMLFMLLVITIGIVVAPDLVQGGRRSQEARYLLPAFLMLMFMVAFALTHALGSERRLPRSAALGLWVGLLALGLWSGLGYVRAETWWNKSMSSHNAEVARHIDAAARPLVICPNGDINPGEVLSLAHEVAPDTRFLLTEYDHLPAVAQLQGDVFLVNSSAAFREYFARYGEVKEVHKQGRLWRFIPRSRKRY